MATGPTSTSSPSPSPSSSNSGNMETQIETPLFQISERVLCLQGPKLYEAKILEIRHFKSEVEYFVHYRGWDAKKWDHWIPQSLVLPWTEENLKVRKYIDAATDKEKKKTMTELNKLKKSGAAKRKPSKSGASVNLSNSTHAQHPHGPKLQQGTKRRKRNESIEPGSIFQAKQEIEIEIPCKLKQALLDDWNYIFDQELLTIIPAEHSVNSIIENYVKYAGERENNNNNSTAEMSSGTETVAPFVTLAMATDFCIGIKEYFNSMLRTQLLYGMYEKEQLTTYEKYCTQKNLEISEMSSVYGPYHLLRLFTKIGNCLIYTALEPDDVKLLRTNAADFLQFLESKFRIYFDTEDVDADDGEDGDGDGDESGSSSEKSSSPSLIPNVNSPETLHILRVLQNLPEIPAPTTLNLNSNLGI